MNQQKIIDFNVKQYDLMQLKLKEVKFPETQISKDEIPSYKNNGINSKPETNGTDVSERTS